MRGFFRLVAVIVFDIGQVGVVSKFVIGARRASARQQIIKPAFFHDAMQIGIVERECEALLQDVGRKSRHFVIAGKTPFNDRSGLVAINRALHRFRVGIQDVGAIDLPRSAHACTIAAKRAFFIAIFLFDFSGAPCPGFLVFLGILQFAHPVCALDFFWCLDQFFILAEAIGLLIAGKFSHSYMLRNGFRPPIPCSWAITWASVGTCP